VIELRLLWYVFVFLFFWLGFEDFAFSVVKAKRDVFLLMVF
jgi:hypothetical protein